jgi:hypothetical protein
VLGPASEVAVARTQMTDRFHCHVTGNMDEYAGCKLDRNEEEGSVRFTQSVHLQSFVDESELPDRNDKPTIPAELFLGYPFEKENKFATQIPVLKPTYKCRP